MVGKRVSGGVGKRVSGGTAVGNDVAMFLTGSQPSSDFLKRLSAKCGLYLPFQASTET